MKKKKKPDGGAARKWLLIPLSALVAAFLINFFIIVNARVPSGSMRPTVPENSAVLGLRTSYAFSPPERGDSVFFRREDISPAFLIKRIVALPGEAFEMRGGRVFINGEELSEDYVSEFSSEDIAPITLPDDAYILLGDDRLNSSDSRAWDDPFVRRGDIKAKALFVYLPRFSSLG